MDRKLTELYFPTIFYLKKSMSLPFIACPPVLATRRKRPCSLSTIVTTWKASIKFEGDDQIKMFTVCLLPFTG